MDDNSTGNEQRGHPPTWKRIAADFIKAYADTQGTYNRFATAQNKAANWIAWAIVAIAFFTFVAICVAIAQWAILSRTLTEAKRSTVEANRAWIAPGGISLNRGNAGQQEIYDVTVLPTNLGRDPALDTVMTEETSWVKAPKGFGDAARIRIRPNRTCTQTRFAVIGTVWPNTKSATVNAEDPKPMKATFDSRDEVLVAQGCFLYRTFGKVHHTRFCFWTSPDPGSNDTAWAACAGKDQNAAD